MLGLIVWCIIIIVIACCIMPWWFLPTMIIAGVLWALIDPKRML